MTPTTVARVGVNHLPMCVHDSVYLFVPKVFKLSRGNDHGIAYRRYDFGGQKVKVRLQKHIEGNQVASVSNALLCPVSSLIYFNLLF